MRVVESYGSFTKFLRERNKMNRNVEKQETRNEEQTVAEMKVKEKNLESKENKTTWAHQERDKSRRASVQHYLRLTFCVSGCFRVRLID